MYFGKDLVGIGCDVSARQAKLKCARDAIENLRAGKLAKIKFAKDGKSVSQVLNHSFRTNGVFAIINF